MEKITLKATNGTCFLVKIFIFLLSLASISFAGNTIVNDSTIVSVLSEKYNNISSYYTKFEGVDYKGEIFFKAPNSYFIVDNNFKTIINGDVTYKTQDAMNQTVISKTDGSYNMYSPQGLVSMLTSKFNYASYDSATTQFKFTAKDKYEFISSALIKFNEKFYPSSITIIMKDGNSASYQFLDQKVNSDISSKKFIYKKTKGYEEIDIR